MTQSQGHRALRKGRHSYPGGIYLVTFGAAHRQPLFRDPHVAVAACRSFSPSARAAGVELMCWVLMPDHFHALLRLNAVAQLSRCVQRIKGRASMECRKACGQAMPIWERAFHDRALRREEDILPAARYVLGNPVRAGLVTNVMEYPYWNAVWL